MRLAQQLYEGVDIKGSGTVGLITYLRTDSVRISDEADAAARSYIGSQYGENYVSEAAQDREEADSKIQDAHEAIRPTDISRTPVHDQRIPDQGPVPPLSADLEALYGKPHGAGQYMRPLP